MSDARVGDELSLIVLRDGQEFALEIVLEAIPE